MTPSTAKRCNWIPYEYPYRLTVPTANQTLANQTLDLDTDADFYLRAIQVPTDVSGFNVRFMDANNYYLSSDYLPIDLFQNEPVGGSYVLDPEIFFPAGSRIGIDVQETLGIDNNVLTLIFRGVKALYV